jgi:pimeloyl-ACP methyl ester carboxylesterase
MNMAPDIPPADARILAVTQGRLAGKAFGETVASAAWKSKPCWFIVTTEDRVVSVELQAAQAKRIGARTTTLQSSHMSLLSHPEEVAAVIQDAAGTVAAA